MNTSLKEIFDLFLMTVTDYRLIDLYNQSEESFDTYLEAWLIFAISDFSMCDQSLEYDSYSKTFCVPLKNENKVILAKLMTKYWLQKVVNDITQMNLHVFDRDFRMASEAQNIKEKTARLNVVKEECSQLLSDYSFKKVNWINWFNQDYEEG